MGDFNTNFMDIANETKRLQKEHTNARSATREEQRKVDQIKTDMAELNTSKEVQACFLQACMCCCIVCLRKVTASAGQLLHN